MLTEIIRLNKISRKNKSIKNRLKIKLEKKLLPFTRKKKSRKMTLIIK